MIIETLPSKIFASLKLLKEVISKGNPGNSVMVNLLVVPIFPL